MQVIVVRILTTFVKSFKVYATHPELQHKARHPIPLAKTETFPLRTTTINEATVPGTIQIWYNVYLQRLKRTPKDMMNTTVPSFNDQLTNARICGTKAMRLMDVDEFERLENLQVAYGVFHKCLNLVWSILKNHQGSINQLGSLKYFFALLEKTCLSNDKPDYHTLLSALMQILHGLILQAWRLECGFSTLDSFASSQPSPSDLLNIAERVIFNYATPMKEQPKQKPPAKPDESSSSSSDDCNSSEDESDASPNLIPDPLLDPQHDRAHRNTRLLIRDLLYVAELIRAVSDGDWGRIEDILGQLVMMFRGDGSNNYSTELLHFLRNLKFVWGEDFG